MKKTIFGITGVALLGIVMLSFTMCDKPSSFIEKPPTDTSYLPNR
jgi:hypothetical protein